MMAMGPQGVGGQHPYPDSMFGLHGGAAGSELGAWNNNCSSSSSSSSSSSNGSRSDGFESGALDDTGAMVKGVRDISQITKTLDKRHFQWLMKCGFNAAQQ